MMFKALTSHPARIRLLKWGIPLAIVIALAIRMTMAAVAFPDSCAPDPMGAGHSQREAVLRAECMPRTRIEAVWASVVPRYWMPNIDLSGKFSERIRGFVREQSEQKPELKKVLEVFDSYLIQYSGYRQWNGRKVVSILGFCPNSRDTVEMLETHSISINGGGACVMWLEYDVETDTFSKLFRGFDG